MNRPAGLSAYDYGVAASSYLPREISPSPQVTGTPVVTETGIISYEQGKLQLEIGDTQPIPHIMGLGNRAIGLEYRQPTPDHSAAVPDSRPEAPSLARVPHRSLLHAIVRFRYRSAAT